MHLRKPTRMLRTTVDQQIRVILEPETGVTAHPQYGRAIRTVQLLVPESPRVMAGLDVAPEAVGPNREYKLPVMPPGQTIQFTLLPEQFLVAGANEAFAECSVIVEYGWENG